MKQHLRAALDPAHTLLLLQLSVYQWSPLAPFATSVSTSFDPAKYHDTYTEDLKKLLKDQAKGQKRQTPPPKSVCSNVIDLVAALQVDSSRKRIVNGCQSICRQKQKWITVRLKPKSSEGTHICVAAGFQSRTRGALETVSS